MLETSTSGLKSSLTLGLPLAIESISYWRDKLAGSIPLLDLPTDRSRQAAITGGSGVRVVFLAQKLVNSLETISRDRDVDLFVILLAVFKVLIYRYVDRQDILIGSPTNHPSHSSTVDLVVFRTDLSGSPTFGEVLDRITQVVAGASAHQVPFDRLIEALEIKCSPSYHPLVQVMFSLEHNANLPSLASSTVGEELSPLEHQFQIDWTPASPNVFDLALKLEYNATGICCHFEYSTDLFNADTIDRMAMHFQTLLAGVVTNSHQSIDELPLLTDSERQQLLVEWNQTQTDYQSLCIHQLFEAQVESTPDNIAVICENQEITYRELNNRANRVANYLRKQGVAPDVPVGICLDRSETMMVSLLGILKAGGAYVPLDPSYPQDRLTYMVTNSEIRVLITSDRFGSILPKSDLQVVFVETDWDRIDRENSDNLGTEVQLENLGYTIYTSGSTGLPKGVAMTQRALCNLIAWQIAQSKANDRAKTLQFAPISFDVSFQEIFSTWCAGGTLVLISDEIRRDPFALLSLLDDYSIERLFLPFVALQQLAEVAVNHQLFPQQLKSVIVAGEQLQITPAISQFFSTCGTCTLHNHYGPSESHVVTAFTLTTPVENWSALPPIGRPIANTQMYVLDGRMQPVPIGIAGELYIGGDCLARGYFQRPELTAERFIVHPFSQDGRARLYKTGDLVRYLADGNIEYLGRIDNQVKIRGFRIELGEIETLLSQHPALSQATVIVREDSPGNKRLVAYCVINAVRDELSSGDLSIQIEELRSFMVQKVPSYMVPAFFVLLPALPMTPSGKVDRRALPVPDYTRQDSAVTFVAPQDRIEIKLTEIWQQVLDLKSIGIKDNFFDLGGDSLLAVRLLGEIGKVWDQKLPLATFLAAPTVVQFATILRQEQRSPTWSSLVKIASRGSKTPLFCIHPIGGNVLEYYPLADLLGLEQPIYGIQSQGLDGIQAPLTQIEAMAASYINEIKTVQPDGPYLLVGYSFGGLIAFEIAHQLASQSEKVNLLALLDTESPNLLDVRPSLFPTVSIHLQNLQQLNIQEKIQYVKDRIVFWLMYQNRANSQKEFLLDHWPVDLPPEYLNVLETNFQAGENYIGKFYPGKITLFRSSIQPINQALHPDLGWGDLADAVEIHDVRGHHSNLLKEPCINVLARQLKLCIDRS